MIKIVFTVYRLFSSIFYFLFPLRFDCQFYPSCAQYSQLAIDQYGWKKGAILTCKRLIKCHPWHPGGIDWVI